MVLVAGPDTLWILDPDGGSFRVGSGLENQRPTCLAADPRVPGRAWCGTRSGGVFRSDDAGSTWQAAGLAGQHVTALAVPPTEDHAQLAGTEPSEVWRSDDDGASWTPSGTLPSLPSSSEWAFPPRPDTHHVRWLACHPRVPGRAWAAVEAGALVSTLDGGRTWQDRVPGGPLDTHELSIHPERPDTLRVAAGDGYFESHDLGSTWSHPRQGLEVGYLRSVAHDPGDPSVVLVSAASRPRSAYVAGHADGRVYRHTGDGPWERVRDGWPDPPGTIAPLLAGGTAPGVVWAADERGVHRSQDGGVSWRPAGAFPARPDHLRGLAVLQGVRP